MSPASNSRRRWLAATLLCAAALTTLGYHEYQRSKNPTDALTGTFSTQLGEHRCEKLPDVSDVCLNTKTTIRFTYNRIARTVELISGEASFAVQKDPRPFDVLSGRVLIRDLSTTFNIYKGITSTLVTVADGSVQVIPQLQNHSSQSAVELHRLQQIEFDEATGTLHTRPGLTEAGLSQVLAWQRGRINLTGQRVDQALEEFARYQPIARFRFEDNSLRRLRTGGEFQATNLMDFLESLMPTYGIRYTLTQGADGQMTVNLSRRQTDVRRRGS